MDIQIFTPEKEGYEAKHSFNDWKVAFLTYAERFDKITYLERHIKTDEIFVLLNGSAELLYEKGMKSLKMEAGKMYNVPKGVWHNIKVSRDALVLIIENKNTGIDNTEYTYF